MITAAVIGLGTMTAAVTAYSAVLRAATKINAFFTASIPGVGLILGVGTALVALTAAMALSRDETTKATYTAKQQKAELERLNEEYERACETYGKTSDEASALRYQMMALSEEYEANQGTLYELMQAHGQLMDTLKESKQAHSDTLGGIEDEELDARALAGELRRLSESYTGTSGEAAVMSGIIDTLNAQYSGLNLTLEDVVNGTYNWGESLDNFIRRSAAAKTEAEKLRRAQELISQNEELNVDVSRLKEEVDAAQAEYDRLTALRNNATMGYNGTTVYDVQHGQALADLSALQGELERTQEAIAANEAEYAELVAYLNGDNMSEAERQMQSVDNVIFSVTAQVQALTEAYNEAYEAAYESISGQYELWDAADKVVATSVGNINSNLESQAKYWADYNDNLAALRDRTAEIEGLGDVIASFADGSADSVNAIAGMAAASDEDLAKMVANWQSVQDVQKAASESIADLKTDFTNQMDELQRELTEDIEAMDLSDEAAKAGAATVQAFIDSADDMLPQVQSAYARLAKAAADALGTASGSTITLNIPAYATGTRDAAPGLALVGEKGPGLVYFNGGEQVMTAEETAAMRDAQNAADLMAVAFSPALLSALRSYNTEMPTAETGEGGSVYAPVNVSVTFQIEGNATPETVEMLDRYGDEFAERVLAVIADRDEDRERGDYR